MHDLAGLIRCHLSSSWRCMQKFMPSTLVCQQKWSCANRVSGSPHLILLQTCRATAHEIAAALAYLHSQDLLHGDLTGGNILLASSDTDERGFCAKVADFGLSRTLGSEPVDTGTYGTVTHMPPELLTTGKAIMLILLFCLFKVLLMTLPVVVAACAYSWHSQTGGHG